VHRGRCPQPAGIIAPALTVQCAEVAPEARLLERKLRAAAGLRRRRVRDGEFSSVTLLYSLPFFSFAYSAKSEAISPAEVSTTSAAPRKR
jgi:hypothetical protein